MILKTIPVSPDEEDVWPGDLPLRHTRGRNHAGQLFISDAFTRAVIKTAFGIQKRSTNVANQRKFDVRTVLTKNYILRNT